MSSDRKSGHWSCILNIHSTLMMPFSPDLWVCRLIICAVAGMVNIVLCCPIHAKFCCMLEKVIESWPKMV